MANESICPTRFNWDNAGDKRINDHRLYNIINKKMKRKKTISMLSFPSDKWIFERKLIEKCNTPFNFHSIERNKDMLKKSKVTVRKLKKKHEQHTFWTPRKEISLQEYIPTTDKTFDIIYTDWMGTWSKEKEKDIHTLFENKVINKNALLIFTIMLSRGSKCTIDKLKNMIDYDQLSLPINSNRTSDNFKAKTIGLTNLIRKIGDSNGYHVKLSDLNEYKGRTQPELSFVFNIK